MEIVAQNGQIVYRTKCLTLDAAARFAKCLVANSRFLGVEIAESNRANGDKRWFVQFRPQNPERQAEMRERQQTAREERAQVQQFAFCLDKDGGRPFYWCHSLASGEVYQVDAEGRGCTCPDFLHRCQPNGLKCKHALALLASDREQIGGF
jgi:hypothetical protein